VTAPPHQSDPVREDLALVQRLLARDEAAWIDFLSRYDRLVQSRIATACREVGRTNGLIELIDEISAEVYAALAELDMKILRSFAGGSRLSTWLSVIVRRFALRQISRLNRLPVNVEPELFQQLQVTDGNESAHQERLQHIAQARIRLSPNDQLVLRLFYDESRSYEEIAGLLKISVNAVGPKLDRARRRLKAVLERPPDD
jgi:RNA polymerase sigma-70 factor (ECF subfamily)